MLRIANFDFLGVSLLQPVYTHDRRSEWSLKQKMMLVTYKPIGRFIALANLQKDILSPKSIDQDIENLVDLISIRVKDKSVEEVANSLLEKIFDLRFDLLEWLGTHDKNTNDYFDFLAKHISVNLQLAPYSNLAETISSVLSAYEKIVSPIFSSLPHSFDEILESTQKNKPEYDTIKFLSLHPAPQIQYLKKWIDASLQLEVGIILVDLILTEQLQFPKKRIKGELVDFLFGTVSRFGAYSIFTNFWTPDVDDTSPLTNRMKILAATIELDNSIHYKTTKEEFFKLVNNQECIRFI